MTIKHRKRYTTYRAKNVADEVIKLVRDKKPVNLQVIQKKYGYTDSSAKQMQATKAQIYKDTVNPVVNSMQSLRDKILIDLNNRNLSKEKMYDTVTLLKNLNHDIQLLSGKSTENVQKQNNVIVFGSSDFLQLQIERQQQLNKPTPDMIQ